MSSEQSSSRGLSPRQISEAEQATSYLKEYRELCNEEVLTHTVCGGDGACFVPEDYNLNHDPE